MKFRLTVLMIAMMFVTFGAIAQEYVGDSACAGCHANMPADGFYQGYQDSGHPYKLTMTNGEEPAEGTWPWTENPPLPVAWGEQLDWSNVKAVIGNYYWKARVIDHDGFIMTGLEGETTQWNLLNEEYSGYHSGEYPDDDGNLKPYNCGRCHTTGYDAEGGNQYDLPGFIGTWTEEGIRCEACHGPAGDHVADTNVAPPGGIDCAGCHYRDSEENGHRNPWKGGFFKHHQQGEDIAHSPHDAIGCNACHEPHRSVVYNDGGIPEDFSCSNCHPGNDDNSNYSVAGMEWLDCIDCHMPKSGKSGQVTGTFAGDVRSHMFNINPGTSAREDMEVDGDNVPTAGGGFWFQEENGQMALTLDYACLNCHDTQDLTWASAYATGIHTNHASSVGELASTDMPNDFDITRIFPNPFNPTTTIEFNLERPYVARVNVYDALGRMVSELRSGPAQAGTHSVTFDGTDHASGIYFVRLTAGGNSTMQKMMLIKQCGCRFTLHD